MSTQRDFIRESLDLEGMCLHRLESGKIPTISAYEPVNRDALQNYITQVRRFHFHGAQVPFRVMHVNAETGEQREEHIPGCAMCSE